MATVKKIRRTGLITRVFRGFKVKIRSLANLEL
jgi:hypothetical protein